MLKWNTMTNIPVATLASSIFFGILVTVTALGHSDLSPHELENGCYITMSDLGTRSNFPLLVDDQTVPNTFDIGVFMRPRKVSEVNSDAKRPESVSGKPATGAGVQSRSTSRSRKKTDGPDEPPRTPEDKKGLERQTSKRTPRSGTPSKGKSLNSPGDAEEAEDSEDNDSEDQPQSPKSQRGRTGAVSPSRSRSPSPSTGRTRKASTSGTDSDQDKPSSSKGKAKGVLYLAVGESVRAACPGTVKGGSRNTLTGTNETSARITCGKDKRITIEGNNTIMKLEELECQTKPQSEMIKAEKLPSGARAKVNDLQQQCEKVKDFNICNPGAEVELYFAAWQIGDTYYWQIAMCHDPKEVITYFTEHRVITQILLRNSHPNRPSFKSGLSCSSMEAACTNAYKKEGEREVLKGILGNEKVEQIFEKAVEKKDQPKVSVTTNGGKIKVEMEVINPGHFFAAGHLSPDADFLQPIQVRSSTKAEASSSSSWSNLQ